MRAGILLFMRIKIIAFSILVLCFCGESAKSQTFTFECICDYLTAADANCDICNSTIQSRLFKGLYIKKNGVKYKWIDEPYVVKIQGQSAVFTELIPNGETITISLNGTGFADMEEYKDSIQCPCAGGFVGGALWYASDSIDHAPVYMGDTLMIVGRGIIGVDFDSVLQKYVITADTAGLGGGGLGTVTSVSSGNLSPLFTVIVSNPTTTPEFAFSQINQNANLHFSGPPTGAAAAPTFRALVLADILGLNTANNGLSDREAGGGVFRWGERYMNLPDGPFTTDRKQNINAFKAYIGDNTDSTLLVVDGTNDLVGIGVTPLGKLHVKGLGTSTGIGFEVDNSNGSILTKLRDNGQFDMVKSGTQIFKITPGSSGLDGQVALGRNAFCSNIGSMALGTYSEASAIYATAVGPEAVATQQEAFAIGRYSLSRAIQAFTFGHFQDNQFTNSFLLGNGQDANAGSLLTGLYTASIGFGARARVPQFVIRGLELSTHAWTAAGNTVTSTGHGLTEGEPIILYNGSVSSYHTVSSVTNANVFVVSGSAPGASGTNFRTYPGNILEYTNGTDGSKLMVMDRFGFVGIGNSAPSQKLHVTGNLRVTGAVYDSNNDPGTAGQVMSSTVTGWDWIAAPTAPTILTLNNGLTLTGTNGQWGGALVQNTTVDGQTFYQLHKDGKRSFMRYEGNPFTDVNVTSSVDITGRGLGPTLNTAPEEDNIMCIRGHNGTSTYYPNALFFGIFPTAADGAWIQSRSESAYTTKYLLNINPRGGKVAIGRDPESDDPDAHVTISQNLTGSTITGILLHLENTESNKAAMSLGKGNDNIDAEVGYFDSDDVLRITNRNVAATSSIRVSIGGETSDKVVIIPAGTGFGSTGTGNIKSTIQDEGSLGLKTTTAPTGDLTLNETHCVVMKNSGSAGCTYTLPDPDAVVGRFYWIMNHTSQTITLSRDVTTGTGGVKYNTIGPGEWAFMTAFAGNGWRGHKQVSL